MTFRRLPLAACMAALAWALAAPARAVDPPSGGPVIGGLVARMLEEGHYAHHPIGTADSRRFLRAYIEGFDYNHMFFTKADVDGFDAAYGADLGERVRAGDITAAYAIFERFYTSLMKRHALLQELASSTFTFTADESLESDRTKAPWPGTPEEIRDLWRRSVKFELLRARLDGQKPADALKTVLSHYDNLLESYKEFDGTDVLQEFLAALCHAYDPHSEYLAAAREENFNIGMRLALVGIGAALRSEASYTRVVSLIPGGPADVDKRLKPGDKIEAVAQGDDPFLDVVGMKIDRVVGLIRGTKGTVVRLRVIPADAIDPSTRIVIRLVRDEIHLKDREAKAKLVTTHPPSGVSRKLGVIHLPSFYNDMQARGAGKSTSKDVETLLEALRRKGAEGLVLDLRGNGGGALNEAIALTGLFIGGGPVVQVKDNQGDISVLSSQRAEEPYRGPLVVLTSRGSASASEILAAALQDYGRAAIVGQASTFGKGTVQSVIALDSYMPFSLRSVKAGAIHLTIQMFYRISGGSTQNRGVIPDIQLPAVEDHMDITESTLPNALPYDSIRPAAFSPLGSVAPSLAALAAASKARVASSPEFGYLREDIDIYRNRARAKRVSLNEARRLAEKRADERRETRRKKERLARGVPKEEALEISLDSLDGVKRDSTVARSSSTAEDKDEPYARAPSAPDILLEESLNVLSDLIVPPKPSIAGRQPALAR